MSSSQVRLLQQPPPPSNSTSSLAGSPAWVKKRNGEPSEHAVSPPGSTVRHCAEAGQASTSPSATSAGSLRDKGLPLYACLPAAGPRIESGRDGEGARVRRRRDAA